MRGKSKTTSIHNISSVFANAVWVLSVCQLILLNLLKKITVAVIFDKMLKSLPLLNRARVGRLLGRGKLAIKMCDYN